MREEKDYKVPAMGMKTVSDVTKKKLKNRIRSLSDAMNIIAKATAERSMITKAAGSKATVWVRKPK